MAYKNFKVAIYCPAGFLKNVELETLKKDLDFFQRYLDISKVYLETHRGADTVPREKMLKIKEFFEERNIKTSGGITATVVFGNEELDYYRIFNTFCYTNQKHLERLKEIVEYTASLFDEIILDDFFFTACTCPSCIRAKGNLSWSEFRLNLMTEVSREYVIKPAKSVNPNVKLIIKYPNWIESYQETGYNPQTQAEIFDYTYTGTETRDPAYTQQHLPRYASYSLLRWFENLKPGKNLGGWFDALDCIYNIGGYLEQANLTVFAKAKEITLFDFSHLRNSVFVPALGLQLQHLDEICKHIENPIGIPVYHPFNSYGEDHIYDYLGMVGIPLELTPHFPENSSIVFVTADSAHDTDILKKLKNHLLAGKDIIMTSGFLKAMQGKGIEDLTSVRVTDKKVFTNFFAIKTEVCSFSKYVYGKKEVLIPILEHRTNASWQEIVAISGENNFPILMKDSFGKGTIYTLTVPENYSDFYNFPAEVLTEIRKVFMKNFDFYIEAEEKIATFAYSNGTFIIESFLSYRTKVNLHIKNKNKKLIDPLKASDLKVSMISENENIYEISLEPTSFRVLKLEN
ncbi:hypothetical protein [Anaerocellum danielii]|uniref:Permease n=1 Tax=Anaerocellum danielii TaxID=1387557 RepID=A0ABZ0TWU9_9FIRM|nr:hypothetical protein [Caldicellulosiruptor danielii]WPX07717.1 permease [Caldicellulosiruptor danielii]